MAASELSFRGFTSWNAVPTIFDINVASQSQGVVGGRSGESEWSSWQDVPDANASDSLAQLRRPRNSASNKRKRRVALISAEQQTLDQIQGARSNPVTCHKSCPYKNCTPRILTAVSAASLHQKLAWRHNDSLSEKQVAAIFVDEIRAGISETGINLNVGEQACCQHAHAFFNGLWDDAEGRPNRTYRRYVKHARRQPSRSNLPIHDEQKRLHTTARPRSSLPKSVISALLKMMALTNRKCYINKM